MILAWCKVNNWPKSRNRYRNSSAANHSEGTCFTRGNATNKKFCRSLASISWRYFLFFFCGGGGGHWSLFRYPCPDVPPSLSGISVEVCRLLALWRVFCAHYMVEKWMVFWWIYARECGGNVSSLLVSVAQKIRLSHACLFVRSKCQHKLNQRFSATQTSTSFQCLLVNQHGVLVFLKRQQSHKHNPNVTMSPSPPVRGIVTLNWMSSPGLEATYQMITARNISDIQTTLQAVLQIFSFLAKFSLFSWRARGGGSISCSLFFFFTAVTFLCVVLLVIPHGRTSCAGMVHAMR